MPNLPFADSFQGIADVFLHRPALYLPFMEFTAKIMDSDFEPSREEREALALRVSVLNGCAFCISSHRAALVAMDARPKLIAAAESGDADETTEPRFAAALDLAEKLTRAPGKIGQADIQPLIEAGWSEQAIEDILNVISLMNFFNRIVDGFGIEGSTDYFESIGTMLAKGYSPIVVMMREKVIAPAA